MGEEMAKKWTIHPNDSDVWWLDSEIRNEEGDIIAYSANASTEFDERLMVSSPELLHNLRELVEDIEYHGHGSEMNKRLDECKELIKRIDGV